MSIGGIGFVLLIIALLIGEVSDVFDGDADIDADDGVEHSQGGPSIFSFRFIACFATGFGGGGCIAYYYGLGYVLSSLVGTGSAVVLAGILYVIVKFLYKQQASSNVRSGDLVGKSGAVSVAVPAGGTGEAVFTIKGRSMAQLVQSEDGGALPSGKVVTVKKVVGDKLIVTEEKGD
jgi:membrane protein implicated in regulation of membrane protease activity